MQRMLWKRAPGRASRNLSILSKQEQSGGIRWCEVQRKAIPAAYELIPGRVILISRRWMV
jgi:hypothetical protein